jgi:hypothetical protein
MYSVLKQRELEMEPARLSGVVTVEDQTTATHRLFQLWE